MAQGADVQLKVQMLICKYVDSKHTVAILKWSNLPQVLMI